MSNEGGGVVVELRPGNKRSSLASVDGQGNQAQSCSDAQGADVQHPHGEVRGVRWSKAHDVLLVDWVVVGRLTEIPWLAGRGWRLTSVSGPTLEAPSLPGLVQRWLERRGVGVAR